MSELFAGGHNACPGCGPAIVMRLVARVAGENSVIVSDSGCMQLASTVYPYSSWKVPFIHAGAGSSVSVALGVSSGFKALDSGALAPRVVVILGDGGLSSNLDILKSGVEKGSDFCVIVYDNEGLMSSGFNLVERRKPLLLSLTGFGFKYLASASLGDVEDLSEKVRKGVETPGPCAVIVSAPCVPGWRINSDETVSVARLGVECGVHPLVEVDKGRVSVKKVKLTPVSEYLRAQGRFKDLSVVEASELHERTRYWYEYFVNLEGKGKVFP